MAQPARPMAEPGRTSTTARPPPAARGEQLTIGGQTSGQPTASLRRPTAGQARQARRCRARLPRVAAGYPASAACTKGVSEDSGSCMLMPFCQSTTQRPDSVRAATEVKPGMPPWCP